jgi:hypothetical protein
MVTTFDPWLTALRSVANGGSSLSGQDARGFFVLGIWVVRFFGMTDVYLNAARHSQSRIETGNGCFAPQQSCSMCVMPQRPCANASISTTGRTLTESEIRKHVKTVRLVQMELVAATIFPVPCERLRMCRSCCRRIGAKLASLSGPDGLQPTPANQAPEIHPQSITAKQLAKKMRRIGFELDELVTGTQDLSRQLQWKRIWRRVTRLGGQLVALGKTTISDEATICSEPRNRLSKELRECLKSLDAQLRVEMSEWMLKVMDRRTTETEGNAFPSEPDIEPDPVVAERKR